MKAAGIATWAVSPGVRATYSEDGAVLLDIDECLCYSLNLVGARTWYAIESGGGLATFKDILDALARQFTVPRERLVRDIDDYLQDLEKKRLIKAAGPPPAAQSTLGK